MLDSDQCEDIINEPDLSHGREMLSPLAIAINKFIQASKKERSYDKTISIIQKLLDKGADPNDKVGY